MPQRQAAAADGNPCPLAKTVCADSSGLDAQPGSISFRYVYLVIAAALSLSLHALVLACLSALMIDRSVESSGALDLLAESTPADVPVAVPTLKLQPLIVLEPIEISDPIVDVTVGSELPEAAEISPPTVGLINSAERHSETAALPSRQVERLIPSEAVIGSGLQAIERPLNYSGLAARGGSLQEDEVVAAGLRWLLAHQQADGSWRFDHRLACGGACRDAGHHGSTTAATALGLLPLLGRGHSQSTGEHQQAVARAVAYLRSRLIETPYGGDLQEGDMYGQGLATRALCEALAITDDKEVRRTCELAVDYIVYAQNERGGWRYYPKQSGDTTVLGWQVMALKAAERAGIEVPWHTWKLAEEFLDRVQSDGGSAYGYQSPEPQPTTTAVGLLSRMQLGWRPSDDRLQRGIGLLEVWGPSRDDVYYNYYATQVLSRIQNSSYERWNTQIRDRLISTQASDGHEAGSWYFADPHTLAGGRLCDTSLALLTLEASYRPSTTP